YFTSKEHLYAAALLEWASGYPTGGRPATPDGTSDEARLRALMRRAVRAFERYPQMMRAELVLEGSSDPNARALFEQFAASDDAAIAAALEDVSVPALLCSLVHMTGDPSWLRGELRPRICSPIDFQGAMSEEACAEARRRALPVIAAYRDAGCVQHELPEALH